MSKKLKDCDVSLENLNNPQQPCEFVGSLGTWFQKHGIRYFVLCTECMMVKKKSDMVLL